MSDSLKQLDMVPLIVKIVAAYVSNNQMKIEDLSELIELIDHTLYRILSVQFSERYFPSKPAVPIENSERLKT
ncbi:MAG: MucR family transcriptional regulator [Ignavibacteria bacterium]|nr:MucR family transcriptional regulator [Ignavibacteria bacterium]